MRRMLLLTFVCSLLFQGCSKHHHDVARTVKQVGEKQLVADATVLRANPSLAANGVFPQTAWPQSFVAFEPVRVAPFMFGILIVTESHRKYEYGLYIVTDAKGLPPEDGSGVSFKSVGKSIYSIEQKVRRPVRRLHEQTPAPSTVE